MPDRSRAVWLIATSDFQRARFEERALPPGPRALGELLRETIEREARQHEVSTVVVDGSQGVEDTVDAVERMFAETLARGPCAQTRDERRALLREANGATVAQVRGYYARPWATGDAEEVMRTFICECGDTRAT